jgi:hypothetical protein
MTNSRVSASSSSSKLSPRPEDEGGYDEYERTDVKQDCSEGTATCNIEVDDCADANGEEESECFDGDGVI